MSRSQDLVENPCVKYLEWDSENSEFTYWDKSRGEKGEKVPVNLPVRFMLLDELSTIKGFNEKENSGIWSNEVKDLTKQPLVARTKSGVLADGLYKEIKDEVTAAGGKYTKSVYAAMQNEEGDYEIVNFQLKGAAFAGWLEFGNQAKKKLYTDAIICHSFDARKKGKVKYTVPVFKTEPITAEENSIAKEKDMELQAYLKYYFNKPTLQEAATADADY